MRRSMRFMPLASDASIGAYACSRREVANELTSDTRSHSLHCALRSWTILAICGPVNRSYAAEPVKAARRSAPPTASSRDWQYACVLESAQIGQSLMANDSCRL